MDGEQWRLAAESCERLVKDYPASPWAGGAHVALIDIKLERLLDLEGAQKNADAAVQWYEKTPPRPLGDGQGEGVKAPGTDDPFSPFPALLGRPLRDVAYDIYVRAGLLEYLHEQFGAALVLFEKAKPFAPPPNYVVISGKIPNGIERLIGAAKTGKTLTPEIVRKGDPTAKTALMLADIYHEGQQYDKSLELCGRLLGSRVIGRATPEQRSYALFRRGRNHFLMLRPDFDPDAALADYVAAINVAPKAPWAGQAMFFAGNIQWNHKHSAQAAISLWRRAIRDYPNSADADRCAFYVGLAYFHTAQYAEAQRAIEKCLADYPGSDFTNVAKRILEQCVVKVNESTKPVRK